MKTWTIAMPVLCLAFIACSADPDQTGTATEAVRTCPDNCNDSPCRLADGTCTITCNSCYCRREGGTADNTCGLASPAIEEVAAAASCPVGQRTCVSCNGQTTFCAVRCPECAPIDTPAAGATSDDAQIQPGCPLFCTDSPCRLANGTCGFACNSCLCRARGGTPDSTCPGGFESPESTAAAEPIDSAFVVAGETCGAVVCGKGTHCCNPTCSTCVPFGVECTQQTCD